MRSVILFFALVLTFQVNAQVKLKQLERGTANHQIGVTKGANNVQEYRDAYSYITDTLGIGGNQQLTISNDTIYLENGGFVVLPESGGDTLPTMPLKYVHYGDYKSDEHFSRETGKLKFSGIFDLTFPEGSGKTNANIGNNFNANIGLYNFGLGLQNGKSVTSLSTSFFLGFQNAYSASTINYSFFNGYRNGLLSPNKIEFTFMNGTENCHKGNSLFSFFNGYRNGFNATNINFSFLNGNRNGYFAEDIINSFLNGKENGANAQKIEASFLSGDRNAYNSSEIYRSTLIGNSNAYNLGKLYYSIIIGNSNASNGIRTYKSIYLGFQQGLSNAGDYKLAIGMKKDIALISGEFDTEKVRINGTFEIRDTPSAVLDSIYGKTNDDVTRKMAINDLPFVGSSELIDQDSINELDTMYNYDGSILSDGDTIKVPTIVDEYTDNLAVTGTNTKTITLGRNIGSDITATFTDNQRSNEEIEDLVGGMVTGNTESGIVVTYNDAGGKLNFSAADPSVTNELQDFDIAELVGTNLRFSLTNDPTVHTISVASLQNSIWSLDGTQAYYNNGVEVRSLENNFAAFHIKTPYVDWTFLNTGSSSGGNLRLSPSTNKRFQIATSSNDVFFEFVPSNKTVETDPFDYNYSPSTFDYVVRNKSTREWELHTMPTYPQSYLRTTSSTSIGTSTTSYTKIDNLIEVIDNDNNVTIGGTQDYFQVQKAGRYKVQTTYALTASGQSKEFYMSVTLPTNQEVNNRQKGSIIVDSSATTEVNNATVVHTVYAYLTPGNNYSVSIKRSDTNSGALVVLSDTTVEIEFLGINP